jgi:UPF0716 protein FxsA
MVILGGAFLITPGFISDAIGLLLLIPPSRAIFRGVVARLARRRVPFTIRAAGWGAGRGSRSGPRPAARGYDYEGTAHEVNEAERELPSRSGDAER